MAKPDYAALANALLPWVLRAGAREMAYFADGFAVERKADASPVTAADRDGEAILLEGLAAVEPEIPVVAEESVDLSGPLDHETFFLVDPLDGTREFVRKSPDFTINIGLVVGTRPVFGIIYAPAHAELFLTLGEGKAVAANVAPDAQSAEIGRLSLRPLATRRPDLQALVQLGSRDHDSPRQITLPPDYRVGERLKVGSSLKFCRLAEGRADLYPRLGTTSEWDTAAGDAILAAAGGEVTTLNGDPLVYGKRTSAFANSSFIAWGRPELAAGWRKPREGNRES